MELGPVDIVVLAFPGDVSDRTLAALSAVEARNDVRIIDGLVVRKDADGRVDRAELTDVENLQDLAADLLARGGNGLIGIDDVVEVGEILEPGSVALALLYEHVWARELAAALRADEGELIASIRIPHAHIKEAESLLAHAGDPSAPTPS
jgi:uncharacterized membrane protein